MPAKINGKAEILYFLNSGVIKGIENPKLRERYLKLITSEKVSKLVPLCFWFVFTVKFPGCFEGNDVDRFLEISRTKISKKYIKIFALMPQPKEDLVNYLIYSLGYIAHYLFFKLFPK